MSATAGDNSTEHLLQAEDTPVGKKVVTDDGITTTVLSVHGWQARWAVGHTGWIEKDGNLLFKNNIKLLSERNQSLKVFFPLCGKAIEMKWVYDLGHTVVGIDCFAGALQQFFEEHGLEYVAKDLGDGMTIFESADGRVRLYAGDLYRFNSTGEKAMDTIWDRGSLVAINRCDREKYAQLLVSLMAPCCQYLLCIVDYDCTRYAGPPHCLTSEDLHNLYEGLGCSVKLVDVRDAMEEKYARMGLAAVDEKLYLVSHA